MSEPSYYKVMHRPELLHRECVVSVSGTRGRQKEVSSGSFEKHRMSSLLQGDVDMTDQILSMKRHHIWLSC